MVGPLVDVHRLMNNRLHRRGLMCRRNRYFLMWCNRFRLTHGCILTRLRRSIRRLVLVLRRLRLTRHFWLASRCFRRRVSPTHTHLTYSIILLIVSLVVIRFEFVTL
jgi:hypothetical protein